MAQYTRKEVIEEAKKLATMMADIEEIDRFKQLEAKLNENIKVQAHIKKIKALQKQAVNFQAYGKTEALQKVEGEIDRLQNELDEIPVVSEFKETQTVINDILQMVSSTISREVTNEIIRSTEGDVLKGETGSKSQQSGSCH
ncbi:RicAFT regulatory complex protein RicA family protein [Halobacillus yeomjeoni]|uniref:RicAFT regulatory complex protein RicA family protein n=1 Tax=Halobacillus yeomjeoni TaxID=311194 RepID=A0A931HUC3_9BACI|nr:YlbF family regulator [Halobacillus yeomjeoni]MBH0229361.1 RicAFT regulatory complex protein RicA family protein [Halobacillus yeomjeoni]